MFVGSQGWPHDRDCLLHLHLYDHSGWRSDPIHQRGESLAHRHGAGDSGSHSLRFDLSIEDFNRYARHVTIPNRDLEDQFHHEFLWHAATGQADGQSGSLAQIVPSRQQKGRSVALGSRPGYPVTLVARANSLARSSVCLM